MKIKLPPVADSEKTCPVCALTTRRASTEIHLASFAHHIVTASVNEIRDGWIPILARRSCTIARYEQHVKWGPFRFRPTGLRKMKGLSQRFCEAQRFANVNAKTFAGPLGDHLDEVREILAQCKYEGLTLAQSVLVLWYQEWDDLSTW